MESCFLNFHLVFLFQFLLYPLPWYLKPPASGTLASPIAWTSSIRTAFWSVSMTSLDSNSAPYPPAFQLLKLFCCCLLVSMALCLKHQKSLYYCFSVLGRGAKARASSQPSYLEVLIHLSLNASMLPSPASPQSVVGTSLCLGAVPSAALLFFSTQGSCWFSLWRLTTGSGCCLRRPIMWWM